MQAEEMFTLFGKSLVLAEDTPEIRERAESFLSEHGKTIVLLPQYPKGPLPFQVGSDVWVVDLRYGGGVNFVRSKHPRIEGFWPQYSGLTTGLARNVTISDAISDRTPIENERSQPHKIQLAPYGAALASEDYKHQHNHYQNLLVESFNFASHLNAVSIWGDSGAFVPGAKSWGGFFSARSWPLRWTEYMPEGIAEYADSEFDAQLVGIEIDVLNAGLPWDDKSPLLSSAMAKVGLQLVGFGKRNTAAIEIRTEDSDDPSRGPPDRRGAWHWGIILRNALSDTSTVLMSENGHIKRGIDFDKTTFKEGALRISGAGEYSGILFDEGLGGQIYSEHTPEGPVLKIRAGKAGLVICDHVGQQLDDPGRGLPSAAAKFVPPYLSGLRSKITSSLLEQCLLRQDEFERAASRERSFVSDSINELAEGLSVRFLEQGRHKPNFLHIPKAAGSYFGYNMRLNTDGLMYLGTGTKSQLDQIQSHQEELAVAAISGHLPFGTHRYFEGSFATFSSLRPPVDRLLSEYSYLVSAGLDEHAQALQQEQPSVLEYLAKLQSWQVNPAVKYISGRHPIEDVDEWEAFSTAVNNLKNDFWLVSPVGSVDVLLLLVARRFKWRLLSQRPRNVSFAAANVDKQFFAQITEPFTFADALLYDIVEKAWKLAEFSLPSPVWEALHELRSAGADIIDVAEPHEKFGSKFPALHEFVLARADSSGAMAWS